MTKTSGANTISDNTNHSHLMCPLEMLAMNPPKIMSMSAPITAASSPTSAPTIRPRSVAFLCVILCVCGVRACLYLGLRIKIEASVGLSP